MSQQATATSSWRPAIWMGALMAFGALAIVIIALVPGLQTLSIACLGVVVLLEAAFHVTMFRLRHFPTPLRAGRSIYLLTLLAALTFLGIAPIWLLAVAFAHEIGIPYLIAFAAQRTSGADIDRQLRVFWAALTSLYLLAAVSAWAFAWTPSVLAAATLATAAVILLGIAAVRTWTVAANAAPAAARDR